MSISFQLFKYHEADGDSPKNLILGDVTLVQCINVHGFRSLVEVESTYWGVVKLFNMQNKLMDVHQSDISKILLCFFHRKLSFLYAH